MGVSHLRTSREEDPNHPDRRERNRLTGAGHSTAALRVPNTLASGWGPARPSRDRASLGPRSFGWYGEPFGATPAIHFWLRGFLNLLRTRRVGQRRRGRQPTAMAEEMDKLIGKLAGGVKLGASGETGV